MLSDRDKREVYDRHGEEGLKGGGGPSGMDDIMNMFMGGRGGGGPQKKRQVRVKPITRQVEVSLADIYNGKTVELDIDRQRICSTCNGVGGTDSSAVQPCTGCKGRGMKTTMRQVGPGMYSQSTGPCEDCSGQGEMIDMAKRCKTCKGKKVKRDRKKLSLDIDKGSPNGEQFTIHGEGDCVPDVEPGDVVVVIKVRPNKIFSRKGGDLLMEKEITLLDALTGVNFTIMHLDGRIIRIQGEAGRVIKPNEIMTCEHLGMPFHKSPYKFGNLFITFKIKFPDTISQPQISSITDILKGQKKGNAEQAEISKVEEAVVLSKYHEA